MSKTNILPKKRHFSDIERHRILKAAAELQTAPAEEVISWAFDQFGEQVTIATGFGVEGMVLIDMALKINLSAQIFFLDTGLLFAETYALRQELEEHYQVKIPAFSSDLTIDAQQELYGKDLWQHDPDLCCQLRKLEPLKKVLAGYSAWMTAVRREQTAVRAYATAVEWDEKWQLVKINPLVRWSKKEIWQYISKHGIPYNPLYDQGYTSIGCTHCTRPIKVGEDERAGRWSAHQKTECGLHTINRPLALNGLGGSNESDRRDKKA